MPAVSFEKISSARRAPTPVAEKKRSAIGKLVHRLVKARAGRQQREQLADLERKPSQ